MSAPNCCARSPPLPRPGLTRYFLSNSGAEAIEAAIKFARAVTGRPNLVAAKRGYHGRTLGALAATADQKYRAPFEPLAPTTTHVSFNDVAALQAAVDDQTAAILLEPIQGEGGIWPASPEYLQSARDIADRQRRPAHRRRDPDGIPHRDALGNRRRQGWFPTSS